jgi:hypothetical protein
MNPLLDDEDGIWRSDRPGYIVSWNGFSNLEDVVEARSLSGFPYVHVFS